MYVQMSRGTEGIASFTLRRHLDKPFAKAASPSVDLAAEVTRIQNCHETKKSRFERTRCPNIDTIDDESPAKRHARSTSTSRSTAPGSESSRNYDSGCDESSSECNESGSESGSDSDTDDESGSD